LPDTIPFEKMNSVWWEGGCRFHRYREKTWKTEIVAVIFKIYCLNILFMFLVWINNFFQKLPRKTLLPVGKYGKSSFILNSNCKGTSNSHSTK